MTEGNCNSNIAQISKGELPYGYELLSDVSGVEYAKLGVAWARLL